MYIVSLPYEETHRPTRCGHKRPKNFGCIGRQRPEELHPGFTYRTREEEQDQTEVVFMAWPNIVERQAKVRQLMAEGVPYWEIRRACSIEFACSRSAITADIHRANGYTYFVSTGLRRRIRDRDNYTCQYCGIQNPKNGVVEHIVPFALGGRGKEYNLVFACHGCNMKKRRTVWIPRNLDEITKNHLEWREKVISMAENNPK